MGLFIRRSKDEIDNFKESVKFLNPTWSEDDLYVAKGLFERFNGILPKNLIKFDSVADFFDHIGHETFLHRNSLDGSCGMGEIQYLYQYNKDLRFEYGWRPYSSLVSPIIFDSTSKPC